MTDALTNLDRLAEMWADLDPVDDWRPHIRDAIEEITRLRAAIAAPPGWVLAPAEPTQKMRTAAHAWTDSPTSVYRAMLAAAPDAPQSHPQR